MVVGVETETQPQPTPPPQQQQHGQELQESTEEVVMKTDTEKGEVVVVRITFIKGGCVQDNAVNEKEQRGLEENCQQNQQQQPTPWPAQEYQQQQREEQQQLTVPMPPPVRPPHLRHQQEEDIRGEGNPRYSGGNPPLGRRKKDVRRSFGSVSCQYSTKTSPKNIEGVGRWAGIWRRTLTRYPPGPTNVSSLPTAVMSLLFFYFFSCA